MVEHTMHTLWWHTHQVLYPTEGSPVAAAIMSCGLISKLFESILWLKNRGSCVQACGVIYEGTPLISSTFGLRTFFWRLALIVKSGFNYSDTTWAPWRFRTKTTPNKRPKLCITNPLWGGEGWGWGRGGVIIGGFPQKGSLMRKTFSCYAGESVWNQGRISNTMYRNLCWIP